MKNSNTIFLLAVSFLVMVFSAVEGNIASAFFHKELNREIDEVMIHQAHQVIRGYELAEQNRGIFKTGVQNDALELNRSHGNFLLKVIALSYQDVLSGETDRAEAEARIASIVSSVSENSGMRGHVIRNFSSYRNDVDGLIRKTITHWGLPVTYMGNSPSDLLSKGRLDIVIGASDSGLSDRYAGAVYYEPMNVAVLFEEANASNESTVDLLYGKIQENFERNIQSITSAEDIIILDPGGYSLYSGRFYSNSDRRMTRIMHEDWSEGFSLIDSVKNKKNQFHTMDITTPEGTQRRYAFIQYDAQRGLYVIVSRKKVDLETKEGELIAISRAAAGVNLVLMVIVVLSFLGRRKEGGDIGGN